MSDTFVVVQLFQFPTYVELAVAVASAFGSFGAPRTVQIFLSVEPLPFNNFAASQLHLVYSELMVVVVPSLLVI